MTKNSSSGSPAAIGEPHPWARCTNLILSRVLSGSSNRARQFAGASALAFLFQLPATGRQRA